MTSTTTVLEAIFEVFGAFATWIVEAVQGLIPMFWSAAEGLTFMGTLAVCGLAVSIICLLLGIIQSFLHFRG